MPVTRKITRESSRVGSKNYKSPPPLRFKTIRDAKEHIRANKFKVKEHHQHTRGVRIQVVDTKGKTRTISIERPRKRENGDGDQE